MQGDTLILPAKPGYSLFLYNLKEMECVLVGKIDFSLQEIRDGVKKEYKTIKIDDILYLQEIDLKRAKKKFEKFIRHNAKLKFLLDEKNENN